jgi:hypothetical protein
VSTWRNAKTSGNKGKTVHLLSRFDGLFFVVYAYPWGISAKKIKV